MSGLILLPGRVWAQERITDQVSITLVRDRLFAATSGEGIIQLPLASGEDVQEIEAKGITGFVQTSLRLLGFSAPIRRWVKQRTELSETIQAWHVTPRLIFVQGQKRLYGFQGRVGRWKVQALGVREEPSLVIVKDHVVVVMTESRVLAFSAFTGGFFTMDSQANEMVNDVQANDNIVILTLEGRKLIFRSRLAIWAELR